MDDELDFLKQAKTFLEKEEERLDIETTTSAEEGLELLEGGDYDAIVSDYKMPGMDGLEFLKTVREDRESDIPFIVFTGKGREDVAIDALNLGADRYLQKGGNPGSQYGVLAQAIAQEIEYYRSKKKLRHSEKRYKRTIETAGFGIAVLRPDKDVKLINSKMSELTGLQKKDLIGFYTQLSKLSHSDNKRGKIGEENIEIALEEEKSGRKKVKFIGDNEDSRVLLFEEFDLESEELLLTARDITEKEEVKEILQNRHSFTKNVSRPSKVEMDEKRKNPGQKGKHERFEPPEKIKNKLEHVEGKMEELISFQSTYTKRVLKFAISSWIFSISAFISILILYKGPELFLNAPPLSVSLLMGALAAPITIITIFLREKQKKIKHFENAKTKLLKRYEKALIVSEKKEAEEKKEFLHSLLRHDVKNKAIAALGYHELLKDFDIPEEGEEYLDKAKKAIQGSLELIEKVRNLRGIEEAEINKTDVKSVLGSVVDSCKDQASKKGINIELNEYNATVKGGKFLEELFTNLIENSIRHSGGSQIKISGKELNGECVVSVEDDGKGIPDGKKEKIFEKGYKKGENAGSGLGMYLVKEIANTYGGSVEVKDSELGGARFDVHLQKA